MAHMLRGADASTLITEKSVLEIDFDQQTLVFDWDLSDERLSRCPASAPGSTDKVVRGAPPSDTLQIRSEDCVYVMYTSGSTGTPKGVPPALPAALRLL